MIAELRGVTKKYGEVVALANLTLGLEPGCVTAVLGPNGAGKTSAIRLLLGLTRPTSGNMLLFGSDPRSPEARRRRRDGCSPRRHATLATSTRRMSSIP